MKTPDDAIQAAQALRNTHDFAARTRWRVRAIMDGGPDAIRALLGDAMEEDADADLPWPNLLYSGLTRAAQKIGHLPRVRINAPRNTDSDTPKKAAEKRQRIVNAYDEEDRLELHMPQLGRWVPGYGFGVWTLGARSSADGVPYPRSEMRDSYDAFPGEWGVEQAPIEMAIVRRIETKKLEKHFPEVAGKLPRGRMSAGYARQGGGVLLSNTGWANQYGRGVELVEYYDEDGTHLLIPEIEMRVSYIPNPLRSGPAFVIPKRFAFNQLIGQYDHMLGLMGAMAKINILSIIAMEDAVFTETNVIGDMDGQYRKGRYVVNRLAPGTQVAKPQSNLPYQLFETINRIERQARLVAGYPIQDDAQSPLSFATGAGLEELQTSVSNEVREYHKVFRFALQDLDAKRLEWDEAVSPLRRKTFPGIPEGTKYAEKYRPRSDIASNYKTEREYGLMAGWDDPQKIVGGLQMISAKVLDRETFQKNIDGLENNLTEINERIADYDAREALMQALVAAAQQGDPKAHMALIEMLPASDLKTALQKFYTPQDPQMSEEEAAMAGIGPPGGGQDPVTTILSRLTGAGSQGGVQTVARV